AQHYGVTGLGITISQRHCQRGNATIGNLGLSDKVRIEFNDFRGIEGTFDKVSSVGMMEHIPRALYNEYVKKFAAVLKPQGIGLLHTIGCGTARNVHDPFIQQYIFPDSNQPPLSEIAALLEQHRLAVLDVENIKCHYGYTVLEWLKKFR